MNGAQDVKQPRFAPIFTARFLTGLWLQRSPLRDPSTRAESIYYGGRPEALISGQNVELTNNLTLARRAGTSQFSLQTVSEAVNSFYSFKTFTALTENIQVMMDGLTQIYTISPAAAMSIYTKSGGAGQASFLGVNNWLYIGDGIDQRAWGGTGTTRNWGIGPGGLTLTSAYATVGASANTGSGPGNQGPSSPFTAVDSGVPGPTGNVVWQNPTFSEVLDGIVTTAQVVATDNGIGGINQGGSDYLQISNFGFTIPAGATITGVAATIYKQGVRVSSYPNGVIDDAVYLVKAGAIQSGGTNHADIGVWPISYIAPTNYGSSVDLWGIALTPSDVNNSGFGIAIAAATQATQLDPRTDENIMSAQIDYASIAIYYTIAGTPSWTNPTNIQGPPNAMYATAVSTGDIQTAALLASGYGFSLSGTVTGVQVNITGHVSALAPDTVVYAQLQDSSGNPMGSQKSILLPSTTDVTLSLGSTTDLWGTGGISLTTIGSASFGVQITVSGSGQTFSLDSAQIVPATASISATPTGMGSFSAVTNYSYVYEYANQNVIPPVFSNASAVASTGAFTSKAYVGVSVVASPDPQVTNIWVFRTADGGSQYEALPTNPYPNVTTTIQDSAPDSELNSFQLAALNFENTPPPIGIGGMVIHMNRMWGFANNVLYYAVGSDLGNILGNPYEGWPPADSFTLPSKITKLVSTAVGLIVITISDTFIVYGNASAIAASTGVSGLSVFYVAPYASGIGARSQFAVDVNGTTIYMYTSDQEFLSIDQSTGYSELGFPIGIPNIAYPNDPSLASFDPADVYVSWHVAGSPDKAVYLSDGSTGWFRCNTSQAPEGGFVWSPKANITGGCQAVQSIETSPGVHQLMIGPGTGGGAILYRNLSTYTDNGVTYPANLIMGSIVLAYPGQVAEIAFITCDFNLVGTSPILSVLPNEISGPFFSLSGYVHSDPPSVYGTTLTPTTLFSNRYDWGQTVNGAPPPPDSLRHLQIQIDFGNDGVKNELLTLTIYGTTQGET